MTATVNAFPPLHALNSSRGWFIALIALLHAGFFWALTHGVSFGIVEIPKKTWVVDVPITKVDPPPVTKPIEPVIGRPYVPKVEQPRLRQEDDEKKPPIEGTTEPQRVPPTTVVEGPGSGPSIIEPQLDPRYPFTEPEYPVSEIRQAHEGTVLLALQILPNGRVGGVRIEQSSGYVKLDDAAMKEARKWRMKPGSSDGAAMAMWKKVPIKFQLKN